MNWVGQGVNMKSTNRVTRHLTGKEQLIKTGRGKVSSPNLTITNLNGKVTDMNN